MDDIVNQYYQIIKNKISASRFESAIGSIEKLILNFPDDALGYYYQGVCEFALRYHENAICSYKKSLSLDCNNGKTYFNLGVCYFVLEDRQKALVCFTKALLIFMKDKELDKKQRCIQAIRHVENGGK